MKSNDYDINTFSDLPDMPLELTLNTNQSINVVVFKFTFYFQYTLKCF